MRLKTVSTALNSTCTFFSVACVYVYFLLKLRYLKKTKYCFDIYPKIILTRCNGINEVNNPICFYKHVCYLIYRLLGVILINYSTDIGKH